MDSFDMNYWPMSDNQLSPLPDLSDFGKIYKILFLGLSSSFSSIATGYDS
jgi:hypothetical protein